MTNHPDQLGDERTTTTSDETPVNRQHTVVESLCTEQQRRERLITTLQKEHRPIQEEEPRTKLPVITRKRPTVADYFNRPEKESTATTTNEPLVKKQRTTDEPPVEKQHAIAEALCIEQQQRE
jgi:hypothetical protein